MTSIPSTVFKAYDIRGTLPDQLNNQFAFMLGLAIGQKSKELGVKKIAVGYDGRHSSPSLSEFLQKGLNQTGINTLDLTMVPTPLVYYAAIKECGGSGIAITGSHNPPEYNGFKIMLDGHTLYGDQITELHTIMCALNSEHNKDSQTTNSTHAMASETTALKPTEVKTPGIKERLNIIPPYIADIKNHIKLQRPMKIAIDSGNGVAGVLAEELFAALGCKVDTLYCDVDGNFPNHHPDPAVPENLVDLIEHVKNSDCELGLAFDGDADRLGVVTKDGEIIWPDRQLILFAQDVLNRNPNATVIFDVKCSRHVGESIKQAGGIPLMWQTGHSLIKAKMKETKALLGGEMSGHIFFSERWYGFDDGLYSGVRLLEILSATDNPSKILKALPQDISTPELKLEMQEGQPHKLIDKLQKQGEFPSAQEINTIDGVRAEYADGFGLARASNTTPVVVLRFEAQTQEALDRIKNEFTAALIKVSPEIDTSVFNSN